MPKIFVAVLFVAAVLVQLDSSAVSAPAGLKVRQNDNSQDERRVLSAPQTTRHRRVRRERRRRHRHTIGSAYRQAGVDAGRGGARFGKNIARGRVVRGGKELGKGMGGFGKNTGIGTARVGKLVGQKTAKGVKRAATP